MKYDVQKAFPYPVLSDNKDYNDDYPERDFQATIKLKEEGDSAILTVRFEISEEAILGCIKKKNATYGVHVLCAKTNYRRLIRSHDKILEHRFESGELYDKVVLMGCVVCLSSVASYKSENFHNELSGREYNMPEGGVLAIAEPESFVVDSSLNRPLASVFHLREDGSIKTGEFRYDIEGETILIKMNRPNFKRFNMGRKNSDIVNFLIMSVYYPVLIEVLRVMSSDEGAVHESKKWYRAISQQLARLDINISQSNDDNIYLYAQRLMEYPLTKLPLEDDDE